MVDKVAGYQGQSFFEKTTMTVPDENRDVRVDDRKYDHDREAADDTAAKGQGVQRNRVPSNL